MNELVRLKKDSDEFIIKFDKGNFFIETLRTNVNGICSFVFPIPKEKMSDVIIILSKCISRNSSESSDCPDYLP